MVKLWLLSFHFASEWGHFPHCYPELLDSRNKGHRLKESRPHKWHTKSGFYHYSKIIETQNFF